MDDSTALNAALDNLIAATNQLLTIDDPDGGCLVAALAGLEAQHDLSTLGAVAFRVHDEVYPLISTGAEAARAALHAAVRLLDQVTDPAAAAIAAKLAAIAKAVNGL